MTDAARPPGATSVPVGRLLEGKVAVVTGGGGGMGRGYRSRSPSTAARSSSPRSTPSGPAGRHRTLAIREARQCPSWPMSERRRTCSGLWTPPWKPSGRIDVLVNMSATCWCADHPNSWTARSRNRPPGRINFLHILLMTMATLPHMIKQSSGSIINVTSVEAHRSVPHRPVYAAYKAAAAWFTRSLMVDLGRHGVRVNELAPDITASLQMPFDTMMTDEEKETDFSVHSAGPHRYPGRLRGRRSFPGVRSVRIRHGMHDQAGRRNDCLVRLVPLPRRAPRVDQHAPAPLGVGYCRSSQPT